MRGISALALASLIIGLSSCGSQKETTQEQLEAATVYEAVLDENPASKGFDKKNSDERAIAIADEVMKAMGGRQNWDNTRYIQWTFFGRRQLTWDKWDGNVRIDFKHEPLSIMVNVNELEGKVWKEGVEITDPTEKEAYLKKGKSIWINDSYWLVMPYKLKDSGVTLKYAGERANEASGNIEDVLELTFKNVGDTPANKYEVTVDQESNLVTSWAFYAKAAQEEPNFINPWTDYQQYGNILLSGGRGKNQLSDIQVLTEIPDSFWETGTLPVLSQKKE